MPRGKRAVPTVPSDDASTSEAEPLFQLIKVREFFLMAEI